MKVLHFAGRYCIDNIVTGIMFLFSFLVITDIGLAQDCERQGGTAQAANRTKSFNWTGPTESTVTVNFTNKANSVAGERMMYLDNSTSADHTFINGSESLNIKFGNTIKKHGGHDGNNNYEVFVTYTFSKPVPADEIIFGMWEVDTRGKTAKGVIVQPVRGRFELSGPEGVLLNRDFEKWKISNNKPGWEAQVSNNLAANDSQTFSFSVSDCHPSVSSCEGKDNGYIVVVGQSETLIKSITMKSLQAADDIGFFIAPLTPCRLDVGDLPESYGKPTNTVSYSENNVPVNSTAIWSGDKVNYESKSKHDSNANKDEFDDGVAGFPSAVSPNETYSFNITLNSNTRRTKYYGFWIDWNQDGDFDDAVDGFYAGSMNNSGAHERTIEITVPNENVFNGGKLSYRLRSDDQSFAKNQHSDARGNGETEDYISLLTLALQIESWFVVPRGNDVYLEWKLSSGYDKEIFIVERSDDGRQYFPLEEFKDHKPSSRSSVYSYIHKNGYQSIQTVAYYRIKQIDQFGLFSYTDIQSIYHRKRNHKPLFIYPNPLTLSSQNELFIQGLDDQPYVLYNALGKRISQGKSENNRIALLNHDGMEGVYFLKFSEGDILKIVIRP